MNKKNTLLSIPKSSMNFTSGVFCCLLLCFHITLAQQPASHSIKVLSHVKPDRVLLRWAPTDFTVWQLGNKYGYTIERFQLTNDGTLQSSIPMILHAGIKPL